LQNQGAYRPQTEARRLEPTVKRSALYFSHFLVFLHHILDLGSFNESHMIALF
jgi:hypothetical protein